MTYRDWALFYVRQLLDRGYSVESAENEACWGSCGLEGPGFEIRRGVIQVPWNGGEKFKYRELAKELETGKEPDLFEAMTITTEGEE